MAELVAVIESIHHPFYYRASTASGVDRPPFADEWVRRIHPQVLSPTLPLNGAGVGGAALADRGLPLELLRGLAVPARTVGLIGQPAEEVRHPVGNDVFLSVDLNNRSVDPDPYQAPGAERPGHPRLRRARDAQRVAPWRSSPRPLHPARPVRR